jgi:citrate lyase subunit beta / citryl-CoA lyase
MKSAEAGRRGPRVRSDIWIKITPQREGGIDLKITSKVEVLFGDKIESLIRDGLAFFEIINATVEVEDQGALPFVIMARLEAVVRRLNPDADTKHWLPENGPQRPATTRNRKRRSRLYLPGNEPKFMLNAYVHNSDGLILDLEDSVAPSQKDAARIVVRNALTHLDFGKCEAMVRINQGELGIKDLDFIVPFGIDLILAPKIETVEELKAIDSRVQQLRKEHNIEKPVFLMPIIESAKGAWFAYDIATASENVSSLAIGLEDYTADIGTQRTNDGKESVWARYQVINGAHAAGVQPIDTVFSDISDMDALRESVIEAKSIGFVGKGCIHPRQIAVVHEGFAPSKSEIDKAMKIVIAFEEAGKKGLGVVSLGNKMIDPPVVKRALQTIETAEYEGLLKEDWRNESV